MRAVQLKDEISADSKTNQQCLTNAETRMVCVVTNTFEEETVRQNSLAVDVEEMESELSDAKSTNTTKSSECEERQRLRAKEVVTSRDNAKLLNDDYNLELFKEAEKLIQQEQAQNGTAEHFVAETVPRLRPRSSMTQMRGNRSGRHVTKRKCN